MLQLDAQPDASDWLELGGPTVPSGRQTPKSVSPDSRQVLDDYGAGARTRHPMHPSGFALTVALNTVANYAVTTGVIARFSKQKSTGDQCFLMTAER